MRPGPLPQRAMLRVSPVPECLKQVLVAANTSTIFWRTGSLPIQAAWNERIFGARPDILDGHTMLPAIAEIILVDKAGPLFTGKVTQPDTPLVLHLVVVFWVWLPVVCPADKKLMQVRMFPTHHHLQKVVQRGQGNPIGDRDAPPDRRLNANESDIQLVNLFRCRTTGHEICYAPLIQNAVLSSLSQVSIRSSASDWLKFPALAKGAWRQHPAGGRSDRVIQQVNDYIREVFNGDLGTIVGINLEEQEVTVQFASRSVTYDYADLSELALAWTITIHKSQSSEYAVVILPLFMHHYLLLSRNLLYTGLTRARRLAILVGPTKAIGFATRRVLDRQRYTALAQRLRLAAAR